jgi:hypothetical protein
MATQQDETSREADQTTEEQIQTRAGTQDSITRPGDRLSTETPGGTRSVVSKFQGMTIGITLETNIVK